MATRKIAPALAAGCTVVVKPAELTPLTTLYFAQLLVDAGLPAGVVNVDHDLDAPAPSSEPIIADPRLRKLSFTGSTPVGRLLIAQAANGVLRTSMELGGNAPFVVFDDADLDAAVDGAMAAKFRNIGQACTAANRFIVHESVADEFARRVTERVEAFTIGRGTEPGITIGPLIDDRAVAKATELVDDAVALGAVVLTGGAPLERDGNFFAPTVLTGVAPGSAILRTEIFGPVLAITTFTDEDEAVRLGQRHRVRPRLLRLHPGSRPRPADDRQTGDRHDGAQPRSGLQRGRPVRRGQAVRHRSRRRPGGHPRVPVHEVHADPDVLTGPATATFCHPLGRVRPRAQERTSPSGAHAKRYC